MDIGLVGMGNIGSAIYYTIKESRVYTFDLKEFNSDDWKNVVNVDMIILAIPVMNTADGQDVDILYTYLNYLKMQKYNGLVIIASTVLPGALEPFDNDLRLVSWPQFVNERSAVNDLKDSKYFVLGGKIKDTERFEFRLRKCFKFPEDLVIEHTSHKYACLFKYIRNISLTNNALFWNYIFELSRANNVDYRKFREMMSHIPVGGFAQVAADGYYGVGGTCLPKDLNALDNHFSHEFSKFLIKYNEKIRNE